MNPRVLIVGANLALVSSLRDHLSKRACNVKVALDGAEGRSLVRTYAPSVALLQTRLSDESGYEFVCDIRKTSSLPVIMLADGGRECDGVAALEIGADDFISEPINPPELWARIRAILRRTRSADPAAHVHDRARQTACFCGWRMELGSRRLISPADQHVRLTAREFSLLAVLVKRPLSHHSRKELQRAVGGSVEASDRAIDIHIARIRSKIEVDPSKPVFITTERGVGYAFSQKVEWRGRVAA